MKKSMDKKKVVVGMSGGVDSSVAAWLGGAQTRQSGYLFCSGWRLCFLYRRVYRREDTAGQFRDK